MVAEEKGRLAGDAAAVTQSDRRSGEPGEQTALRDSVEIEYQPESPRTQPAD